MSYFGYLFKIVERALSLLKACFIFPVFLINFQRHLHSIYVWNMIKQGKPLQTRYDTTHSYDRYFIRTHVYVFLFSVKKTVFELSRVWPWRWPREGTPYMVFIGPVSHNPGTFWLLPLTRKDEFEDEIKCSSDFQSPVFLLLTVLLYLPNYSINTCLLIAVGWYFFQKKTESLTHGKSETSTSNQILSRNYMF